MAYGRRHGCCDRSSSALAAGALRTARSGEAARAGASGSERMPRERRRCDGWPTCTSASRHVSVALAPSSHVRERFSERRVRAGADRRLGVRRRPRARACARETRGDRVLRLGFAGALMVSKAPHLLADAVASLPAEPSPSRSTANRRRITATTAYTRDLDRRLAHPAITRHGPNRARRDAPGPGVARRAGVSLDLGGDQRHRRPRGAARPAFR